MHRIYTNHPPHDSSLYDVLRVSPNATLADIQKAYKKLSRLYHPDKQRYRNSNSEEEAEKELEKIRRAYEILKDDQTRLPYHKYGIEKIHTAVLILNGFQNTPQIPTRQEAELLRLMGYHHPQQQQQQHGRPPPPSLLKQSERTSRQSTTAQHHLTPDQLQEQRIYFLAANILERIRPLVEGAISEQTLADVIAQECDRLKALPLGAQIIRCVGRAYRHSGRQVLRKSNAWPEPLRDKWRDAKHFLTAAMASGRVVLKEPTALLPPPKKKSKHKANHNKKKEKRDSIEYHNIMDENMGISLLEEEQEEEMDHTVATNKQMQQEERRKAKKVMIELLQVEALWKVHKIGLYRSVRDACDLILDGRYFFFPSHQSTRSSDWEKGADGWVSSSSATTKFGCHAISANEGRLRAAAALVLVGDVMVQCSKEGTAWME